MHLIKDLVGTFFTTPTDEARLLTYAAQARRIQTLGYDIGFKMLPRFPDAPFLALCSGRYNTTEALGTGYSFTSKADAFIAAFHETLERALWIEQVAFWKEDAVRASAKSVEGPHLDLTRLSGFSSAQRQSLRLGSLDEEFLWSRGFSIVDQSPLRIPAQLISSRYAQSITAVEPLLRFSNSNGLASHTSKEKALLSGMLELIERDAFMITFSNEITPPRIDPTSIRSARLHSALQQLRLYGLTADFVLLPTDMPATVIACVVQDSTGIGPAFALGAKAHTSSEHALYGALTEAMGVWYLARHAGLYQKPLPPIAQMNALERIAFWAQPEHAVTLRWLTSGTFVPLPRFSQWWTRSSRSIARRAQAVGVTFAAATISTPAVEAHNFHAAVVVSPELQPLHLDASPAYLGGERLSSVPKKYGYSVRKEPPSYPHPFP